MTVTTISYTMSSSVFDPSVFSPKLQLGFRQTSRVGVAINPQNAMSGYQRGRKASFPAISGLDAITSARTVQATPDLWTPSGTVEDVAALTYIKGVAIDQLTAQTTPIDVMSGLTDRLYISAAQTFDYHCLTAAVTRAAANSKRAWAGSATKDESLKSTDLLTTAKIYSIAADLEQVMTPFYIPGLPEPVILGFIHPHVKFDVFTEASSAFGTARLGTNEQGYSYNTIGVWGGVLWIPVRSAALINADAGDAAVDVYSTVLVGANGLGRLFAPVEKMASSTDLDIIDDGSMVMRLYEGDVVDKRVYLAANMGFGTPCVDDVYIINSASSKGANT